MWPSCTLAARLGISLLSAACKGLSKALTECSGPYQDLSMKPGSMCIWRHGLDCYHDRSNSGRLQAILCITSDNRDAVDVLIQVS